ncbi:MAG: DUF2946 family protein [Acetobacteraceae bacterium]
MPKARCATNPWLWAACLLAIALQIVLPIVSFAAMAATFDPLDHAAICGTPSSNDGTGGLPGNDHACICPVCQVAGTQQLALTSTVADVPRAVAAFVPTVFDPAQSAGPRGPPLHRPRARSPPSAA